QFQNALKAGERRQRRPERKDLVERHRVDLGLDAGNRQQRLDLGRKKDALAPPRIKQRPHADTVAGEEQAAALAVPQRKSEVAIELCKTLHAMLGVKVQQNFGVAAGAEIGSASCRGRLES